MNKSYFSIPQAPGQFLLGNLLQFKPDPLSCMCEWHQQYGDLVQFHLGPQKLYMMSHPDYAEQTLIKHSQHFEKMYDPNKPKGLTLVLGQGLVTSKGDLWQRQRRLMQPLFLRAPIAHLFPQMLLVAQKLIEQWRNVAEGSSVDISTAMMRTALEMLTQTMFSTSVMDRIDTVAPALDHCLRYAAETTMNPFLPPLFVPTRENVKFKKSLTVLDQVIEEIIEQRRHNQPQHNDLLTLLLTTRDPETGETMNNRQLRDELITLFTAGHETTANWLSWTLYWLAKYPEIAAKVKQELHEFLQGKLPDYSQLEQLVYTKAVLSESLRMRPPVGLVIRKIIKEVKIGQYQLKAGALALVNIFNIHYHSDFWENPQSFMPERFLHQKAAKYAFIPFGLGERFCLGNHFAQLEAILIIALIMQNFEFKLDEYDDVTMEMAITIKPKGGLRLNIYSTNCLRNAV